MSRALVATTSQGPLTYGRMGSQEQTQFVEKFSTDMRSAVAEYRNLLGMLPSDHPNVASLKDALSCCELALTFYEEATHAVQAETCFAAAAVGAAALEAMLLAKMFMSTDKVAQMARFRKSLDRHKGDFGAFAREEMNLGKLLEMAKELSWFRPGGVPGILAALFEQRIDPDTLTALTHVLNEGPSAGGSGRHSFAW